MKNKYFLIGAVAVFVSLLSIFHVVVGWLKTPDGMVYLWTGHYYLDYYYYLVPISQGARGAWMSFQQFATDDASRYPHLWPYIALGHVASLFHLSPIAAYWIAITILAFTLTLLIFFTIKKLLPDQPFGVQFFAYLFALFSGPFFMVVQGKTISVALYDFWYSTSTFFRRFEPIPHHLLTLIFIVLAFLSFGAFIESLSHKKLRKTVGSGAVSILLLSSILTFNSYNAVTPVAAVFLTGGWYTVSSLLAKKRRAAVSIVLFCIALGIFFSSVALALKNFYSHTTFLANFRTTEANLHQAPGIPLLLLSLGPLVIFFPFGLFRFFQKWSPLKMLFFALFAVSYLLYLSPLDTMIGTHNGRFLSPLNPLLLGSVGILGIVTTASFFKRIRSILFFSLVLLLGISFVPPTVQTLSNTIHDRNIFSPITYLPSGIIAGFKQIDRLPKKGNVLVTPSQFLGTVLPVYSGRKNYVARHIITPNYIEKNIMASNFYLGALSNQQALEFLNKNDIVYVVLTSIEGYDKTPLYTYPFLEEIYKNKDVILFEVVPNKLYDIR